jgi:hypothetical protein
LRKRAKRVTCGGTEHLLSEARDPEFFTEGCAQITFFIQKRLKIRITLI